MSTAPPTSRLARRILLVLCVTAWVGAFVATHLPAIAPAGLGVGDKLLHFVGYFSLTAIFLVTLISHGLGRRVRTSLVTVVMPIYGGIDELSQPWFARTAAWSDWFFDLLGVVAAAAIVETIVFLLAARKNRLDAG